MIHLLGGLLAENVVDTPNGLAFVPLGGYRVPKRYQDKQGDGIHGVPFQCVSLLHLFGNKGEEFTIGMSIRTPGQTDLPEEQQAEKQYVLDEGVLSLRTIIDTRVPFDGPGLYTVRFQLNGKFLVDLSVPVDWDEDDG
ncbi:MAG TPA: hypothetical protein VIP09_07085 [Dehalococcoidia bacterium]|jgi:hypothetical protein